MDYGAGGKDRWEHNCIMHEAGAEGLCSASASLLAGRGRCITVLLGEGESSRQPKLFGRWLGICLANYGSICCHTVVVTFSFVCKCTAAVLQSQEL